MTMLAFIPARGGSKGILRKNLFPLNGKPLIYYSLRLAKALNNVSIPFLSTDDPEIKTYAKDLGFQLDYIRPAELAGDHSSTIDAVFHGIEWYESKFNIKVDSVILLQPTSPIRDSEEILDAVNVFKKKNLDSLVSVTTMREHPYECITEENAKWSYLVKPSGTQGGRQTYKGNYYFIDGSFYIAKVDFLKKMKSFVRENESYLYHSKLRYSIDIDELEDMMVAEAIIKLKDIQ